MPRFYFDTRDNGRLIEDDIGLEFPDLDAAKAQVATSLGELARDVLAADCPNVLAVEVRDGTGPVLVATLRFDCHPVDPDAPG